MDRLGQMDEYDDEQRQEHYRVLQNGIYASEGKIAITEDLIEESKDLVISYYANFIDNPKTKKPVNDSEYMRLSNETDIVVKYLYKSFELKFFYMFCKQIMLMLKRLEEIDKEDNLANMMSDLSVKTNRRKLRK